MQASACDTPFTQSGGYLMPERTAAIARALTELDVRPGDRVLLMLPDGPGFVEAFTVITQQGALPLPVNPLVPTRDVAALAAQAGAQLVLASAELIDTLSDLGVDPPVLVSGPQGPWAAAIRLR